MAEIWVLTDFRKGNQKQALALAESVKLRSGLEYELKIINAKKILKHVPNILIPKHVFTCRERLLPPYPKLIISCGRVAASVALAIKQADNNVKLVQILNPTARAAEYDLLILPRHDMRFYDNACTISGALTDVNPKSLQAIKSKRYSKLQKPILGVLIGGNNKAYKFNSTTINNINHFLQSWVGQGYNIIGTFSRRTPVKLQKHLLSMAQVDFWDGEGDNPYEEILHKADGFAVTCDSINMVSEAYHTGKPTYIIPLAEKINSQNKFSRFHDFHILANRIRPASEQLNFSWKPNFCDDLIRATDAVCKLF